MAQRNGKPNGSARNGNGASKRSNGAAKPAPRTAAGVAYDAFKDFEGKRYTGMKVGRGHKWNYEQGEWTEKKVTPDKWEFRYAVTKRRKGRAPEGSGVPVGTAYHWYILAHQTVTKLDANSYETDMVGMKHKLAHKRADKQAWSASDNAQRKHLIKILQEMISQLSEQPAEQAAAAGPPKPARAARAKAPKKARAKPSKKAERTPSDRHLAAA
jgi:hypothetical protein